MPSATRTCAAVTPAAAVVAVAWLRLERPATGAWSGVALAVLALAVAAVPRARWRAVAALAAAIAAAWVALGVSLLPPRPLDPGAGFGLGAPLREAATRFSDGFGAFYAVHLPFDPRLHAEMGEVVLAAAFGFALAVGLLAAARRPVAAAVALVVGAGWAGTLFDPVRGLAIGTAILVALLALLAGLGARRTPALAVPAAAVVAVAAFAIGSAAAAGHGLVRWQSWQLAGGAASPLRFSFVWDAQYLGLDWPRKETPVLQVRGQRVSRYLRVAVLDDFAGDAWRVGVPRPADALEPAAALERRNETREVVTVEALADTRLPGGSVPIRFAAPGADIVQQVRGFATVPAGLSRGFRYAVWSYLPQLTAAGLRRSPPSYPPVLATDGMLSLGAGATAPAFGAPDRVARLDTLVARHPELGPYLPLARLAEQVAGRARTPYGAVADLEHWFLVSGGFRYSDHPQVVAPPLVGFVTRTRAGYCQYFAGAMALMLRYLGIPARVAVGFAGGKYDAGKDVWTVTDHDAHAWVEAWFRGYGWLPFDPTPPVPGADVPLRLPGVAESLPAPGLSGRLPSGPPPTAVTHGAARAGTPTLGRNRIERAADRFGRSRGSAGTLAVVILLLVAAGSVAGIAALKLAVRLGRRRERDPRRVAAACRKELAAFLRDQRVDAPRGATLRELGDAARRELALDPDAFVVAATVARFGPPERAVPAAGQARRELGVLLRDARRCLSRRERLLGLLSLRSLLAPRAPVDTSASLGSTGS